MALRIIITCRIYQFCDNPTISWIHSWYLCTITPTQNPSSSHQGNFISIKGSPAPATCFSYFTQRMLPSHVSHIKKWRLSEFGAANIFRAAVEAARIAFGSQSNLWRRKQRILEADPHLVRNIVSPYLRLVLQVWNSDLLCLKLSSKFSSIVCRELVFWEVIKRDLDRRNNLERVSKGGAIYRIRQTSFYSKKH